MTEFKSVLNMMTAHVYLIEWVPDDWPIDMKRDEWCRSYVVALSIDEATNRLSSNPADIKKITVLGDVVERAAPATP